MMIIINQVKREIKIKNKKQNNLKEGKNLKFKVKRNNINNKLKKEKNLRKKKKRKKQV